MRIADIMSHPVHHIAADASLDEARAEMTRRQVHHLAVFDGNEMVGLLSARDLDGDTGSVRDSMARKITRASVDTTIREAANLLRGRAIGCLPVFDGDELAGMVTTTDLLELIGRGVSRPIEESKRWTLRRRSPKARNEPAPR